MSFSVRETEILVEQQPPQAVFICDHASLVIKYLTLLSAFHVRGCIGWHITTLQTTQGKSQYPTDATIMLPPGGSI
jgi:hypothetical protein